MFKTRKLAWLISGTLAITMADFHSMQHAHANQTIASAVQISDSKLGPINMGLDSARHWLDKMKPGDSQRGQKLINDLDRLDTRFKRIPVSSDPQYQYVATRITRIREATQAKANQQTQAAQTAQPAAMEASNAAESLENTQQRIVVAHQQPKQSHATRPHRNLSMVQSNLRQIEQSLANFSADDIIEAQSLTEKLHYAQKLYRDVPQSSHPDYVTTEQLLQSVTPSYKAAVPHWTSVDDPQEFLKHMNHRYREELSLPEVRKMMRSRELTPADVEYFLGSIETFNATIETDLPAIIAAVVSTRSRRDISLINWLQQRAPESITNTTAQLQKGLDAMIDRTIDDAERLAALDPEANRYQFVTESVRNNHEESFARALRTMENATALEDFWQQQGRWSSRTDELNQHITGYRNNVAQANTVDQLPEDIGDATLAQIAHDTLAIKKYGVGEITKLIVNSKKVPRDRISSRWFNNRLDTTVRAWEEFQVCTVELEEGKHMVYYNTMRKYSRGAITTPIDKWILADRFKSGEISETELN